MSNPIQQAIEALKLANETSYSEANCEKFNAALSALQSLQGVELPEPHIKACPAFVGALPDVYTADQLRTAVAAAMVRGVVPQDATKAMIEAAHRVDWTNEDTDAVAINVWHAMLAAAPTPDAAQPTCQTCKGWGLIGGPSFYAPDEGGAPCPDCTQPTQAEAPSDPLKGLALRDAEMVAQDEAFKHRAEHAYLPKTQLEAYRFKPHQWVIEAIHRYAAERKGEHQPASVTALATENEALRTENLQMRAALATQQAETPDENNQWIAEAKKTLDHLARFLYRTGAPHEVNWRDWIDSAEKHLATQQAGQGEAVYWQWRRKKDAWSTDNIFNTAVFATTSDSEVRALYTTPPAPQQAGQGEAPSEREAAIEEAFESARFALLRPNSLQSMAHIMDVLHCRVQDVFHQRVAALATQQAGQGEAVGDTHLRRVHDLLDEIPHMLALDRRHESVSKLVHENVMNILAHLNRLPVTPPAPQQPEALAQQERDREDAERWRYLMDEANGAFWDRVRPMCKEDIVLTVDSARAAIRAARSSEGGQP